MINREQSSDGVLTQEMIESAALKAAERRMEDPTSAKFERNIRPPTEEEKEEFKRLHREGVGDITFTPEEEAAAKFMFLLPYIKRAIGNLSAKAVGRVFYRLAEFPFGDSTELSKMGFKSKEEKQLFQLMYEINAAKGTMLNHMKKLQAEESKETVSEDSTVETNSDAVEGEENGTTN